MSERATQATPQDDPGPHAADPHGHRQALNDLVAMGTGIARLLHAQAEAQARAAQPGATAQPTPAPAPDALVAIAAAFDQVARAVRRCVMLARTLDTPAPPASDPARRRAAVRRQVVREVEDRIEGRTRDAAAAEALNAELLDRLDAPDLEDDIGSRPVADIVRDICRDLGLASVPGGHPWKRRTPDDIRQLCARAAAPSGTRQPGAGPQGLGPQDPRRRTTQRPPDPPDRPAATSRAQPVPVHADNDLPDDPAAAVAMILRHPARVQDRWPPPSSG